MSFNTVIICPSPVSKAVFLLSLVAVAGAISFLLRRVPATNGRVTAGLAFSLLPLSLAAIGGAIERLNLQRGILAAGQGGAGAIAAGFVSILDTEILGMGLSAAALCVATLRVFVIRRELSTGVSAKALLLPAAVLATTVIVLRVVNSASLSVELATLAGYFAIATLLINVVVIVLGRRSFATPAPRSATLFAPGFLAIMAFLIALAFHAREGHLAAAAGLPL